MRPVVPPSIFAALLLAASAPAAAQSINTSQAQFTIGYGRTPGQENRAVENYGLRDASGNLVVVDGVVQQGNISSFSASSANASATASAAAGGSFTGGVGQSSATAIGNNLTVITQGDFNTVIVNSTQINNGAVTAGATVAKGGSNGQ